MAKVRTENPAAVQLRCFGKVNETPPLWELRCGCSTGISRVLITRCRDGIDGCKREGPAAEKESVSPWSNDEIQMVAVPVIYGRSADENPFG
jgi:hypothetical protein